jgi:hypothetical protein
VNQLKHHLGAKEKRFGRGLQTVHGQISLRWQGVWPEALAMKIANLTSKALSFCLHDRCNCQNGNVVGGEANLSHPPQADQVE